MTKFSERMAAGDEVIINPATVNEIFVGISGTNTYTIRKKTFHRTVFLLFSINLVKGQTFKKEQNTNFTEDAKRPKKEIFYLSVIPIDKLNKYTRYRSIKGKPNSNKRIDDDKSLLTLFNKLLKIILEEDENGYIKSKPKPKQKERFSSKNKGPVGRVEKKEITQLRYCDIMSQTFLIHCFIKVPKTSLGDNLIHYKTDKNKYINTDLSKLLAVIEDKETKTLYCIPVFFLKLKSDEKD